MGLLKQVDQGTNVTTLTYNEVRQLVAESFNGIVVSNRYNGSLLRSNLQFLLGGSPQLTNAFTYDPAARLQGVSDGTYSASYTYHPNSHLLNTLAFKQGSTERLVTSKTWDSLSRLTSVYSTNSVMPYARYMIFFYNDANQVSTVFRNDFLQYYNYDSLGQVTLDRRNWASPPSSRIPGQQLYSEYDDIGNRKFVGRGGSEWFTHLRYENYTANNLNQYTQRSVPGKVDVFGEATNTAIVTVNNEATYRRSNYFRKELTVTNSASALWQGVTNLAVINVGTNYDIVTNITGNVFVPKTPEIFTHDADGNLVSDGRWTLTWDGENRLTRMTAHTNLPDAARLDLQFTYDHQGRRISKAVSNWNGTAWAVASHIRFVYDGWNLIAELNGTNNAVIRSYMWGSDLSGTMQGAGGVGGLLALNDASHGVHFVHYDGNGNVSALVNVTNGTVSAEYEYGAFGEPLHAETLVAKANPIRFSSKYQDEETEWFYYPFRYYVPSNGRWASRDPAADEFFIRTHSTTNSTLRSDQLKAESLRPLYAFVGNNPINNLDSLGLAVVALYDGKDDGKGGPKCKGLFCRLAKGSDFRRAASIYEFPIDVSSVEDAISKLQQLRNAGVEIDDLYVWDHGARGYQELGNAAISKTFDTLRGRPENIPFKRLADQVNPAGTIHLMGCSAANDPTYIQALANEANRRVTGYSDDGDIVNSYPYFKPGGVLVIRRPIK